MIIDMIRQSCLKYGDKPAFRVKVAGRWMDYSYRQLWSTSDRVAIALSAWGLRAGDRAAILAPASPSWVAAYLGIMKANGIIVPVDKELKRGELRHILADCGARVLFTTEEYLETLRDILDEMPDIGKIILFPRPLSPAGDSPQQLEVALAELIADWRKLNRDYQIRPDDARHFEARAVVVQKLILPDQSLANAGEILRRQMQGRSRRRQKTVSVEPFDQFLKDGVPPRHGRRDDDPAVILYTSGTTGRSKGAMLSYANLASNINTVIPLFGLDETIRTLSFLPINHVFEQVGGILLPLSLGGTVSFAESLKKLGENLAEVKPNFLLGVPAVFRMLLERMERNIQSRFLSRTLFSFAPTRPLVIRKVREALGGTPTFVSGGAALDPEVARGLIELGITVYQGYGITETSPVISAEQPGRQRLGTVGPPIPGVEVRIHEPNEDGVGEIWARGPNIMLGYYNNPQATAEVLTDGWYHTGDLGRLENDGMLVICGRVKNLIVTANGKNVYPEEVETELLHSPFIAEVMVYGHKTSATAEEVYAIIYPNQEAIDSHAREAGLAPLTMRDVEELIRKEVLKAGKNLADYKRVRRFSLREDEFPKTTTRKIKRFAVEGEIDAGPAEMAGD